MFQKEYCSQSDDFIERNTILKSGRVYKERLLYSGQEIVFQGTRNAERGQIYVDSVIQDKQPIEVIWRLRPSKDSYKIVDIIIENVNMGRVTVNLDQE